LHVEAQAGRPAREACVPPAAPTALNAYVDLTTVTLRWKPSSGSPTSYVIEAGSAASGTDRLATDTGTTSTTFTRTAAPGLYYVRVRARNRCGTSDPSGEIQVSIRLEPTKTDVVVVRRAGERSAFFPSVERLADGQLLVVYYDAPEHVSPAGRISIVRSRDNGATWTRPEVIIDTPLDDRDPSVMRTSAGTLLLSFFTLQDHAAQGVFVARSDDDGRTWSTPTQVGTKLTEAATDARIVELDSGELLIPIFGRTPTSAEIHCTVVRSTDQGRTWPIEHEVDLPSLGGIDFVEPALAYLGGGRLMAIARSERTDNRAYVIESTDNGRSWSSPLKTMESAEASDLVPVRAATARPATVDNHRGQRARRAFLPARPDPGDIGDLAGYVVHTWADFSQQFGEGRPTLIQSIAVGNAGSAPALGDPHLVYHGRCAWGDEGYPSSVLLADGRVFTVYYDACAGYIGGSFTSLKALESTGKR
jgi:hypothetical protein